MLDPAMWVIRTHPGRKVLRQIQSRYPNPTVGHAVVHIEPVGRAEIVAPIDTGGKHDVVDGPVALLWQVWGQHRFR